MSFKTINYEVNGPLALIRLNRPDKLNAINVQMVEELNDAMDKAEDDPQIRVIILGGEGKAFSAGFDLDSGDGSENNPEQALREELTREFNLIMRFLDSPKPTIAAVHGYCLGGGFEIALACDLTVAADECRFGEPEVRFGSGIVALLLPWVCGSKHARELLLTGANNITTGKAVDYGLVNRAVPGEDLLEESIRLGMQIARNDRLAVQLTKQAINRGYTIAGMREALLQGLETDIRIETTETDESRQFNDILKTRGTKAAMKWLDDRFKTEETTG
jgi:enoyl-CoA hydratase